MIAARVLAILLVLGVGGAALADPLHDDLTAAMDAPADPQAYLGDRQRAAAAMEAEDYASAEAILERLTTQYPQDADNWIDLGIARRLLNKPRASAAAYEQAIALAGPSYRRARYRLAQMYLKAGDRNASLTALEKMVFEDAYIARPALLTDPNFVDLRLEPRFLALSGAAPAAFADRVTGWRSDLDALMAEIDRLSRGYRHGPLPSDLTATYQHLRDRAAELSDEQMYAGMAQMVGDLNQNHTMLWGFSGDGGALHPSLRYLPLQLYIFPEGVFVVEGAEGLEGLVGACLVSIENVETGEVLTRIRRSMSYGGAAEGLWFAPLRIVDVSLLKGLGITTRTDRVNLRFRLPNGRMLDRTLATVPTPLLSKLPPPAGVPAPTFLRRVGEAHWFETWEDARTVYVQINQIAPGKSESLPDFGLRLRRALATNPAPNLIVDLRNNNGGDTTSYPELLRTIVAFSGVEGRRVFVLISRSTYSAAANFATDLDRLADPIFVGEPTGNTGNQEGDEGAFRLPYSGLRGNIAALRWQWAYPFDQRRSIVPDLPVPLTAVDYFAGRDPALDAIRETILKSGS